MKIIIIYFLFISALAHCGEFPYDREVAIKYSTLIAKDVIRLDMPEFSDDFEFSKNDVYSTVGGDDRKFVFVLFPSKKKDSFFLVVSEICGFDGLGIHRYHYAEFGVHSGDPKDFKKHISAYELDSDLDIPIGCPGWYTQREFSQP